MPEPSNKARDSSGALVHRLHQRDPEVMADLYDLYGRMLYVLVVRIVRNPSVAEDLVQESFMRAWNRSEQLKDHYSSVGPWLVMIARHCALDYLKSSYAHFSTQMPAKDIELPGAAVDEEIIASDQANLIQGAFRNLSEDQRKVIELLFYEGLSQAAIAERLHRPLGTVKGWTRSALARLRGKLDPNQFGLVARH